MWPIPQFCESWKSVWDQVNFGILNDISNSKLSRNCSDKSCNKQYNDLGHSYELTLKDTGTIVEVPDDDPNIPVIDYKIVRYLTPTLGKPSQLIARYNLEKIYNRGKKS